MIVLFIIVTPLILLLIMLILAFILPSHYITTLGHYLLSFFEDPDPPEPRIANRNIISTKTKKVIYDLDLLKQLLTNIVDYNELAPIYKYKHKDLMKAFSYMFKHLFYIKHFLNNNLIDDLVIKIMSLGKLRTSLCLYPRSIFEVLVPFNHKNHQLVKLHHEFFKFIRHKLVYNDGHYYRIFNNRLYKLIL